MIDWLTISFSLTLSLTHTYTHTHTLPLTLALFLHLFFFDNFSFEHQSPKSDKKGVFQFFSLQQKKMNFISEFFFRCWTEMLEGTEMEKDWKVENSRPFEIWVKILNHCQVARFLALLKSWTKNIGILPNCHSILVFTSCHQYFGFIFNSKHAKWDFLSKLVVTYFS